MGSAGIITVVIVGLLFLAIAVLAVQILFGKRIREWALPWTDPLGLVDLPRVHCKHERCRLVITGGYLYVLCKRCGGSVYLRRRPNVQRAGWRK